MKPSKQRLDGVPNTNYSFAEVINKVMDGAIPFSHGPDQLICLPHCSDKTGYTQQDG